jgi:protein-S-isoprenylcysteine O-methyltransferase Ste14
LVLGFWTVAIPYWRLVRHGVRPDFSLAGVPGWLLIAAGAALYFCAVWAFAIRGKGTPLPIDPPKTLIVEGPYRLVRNPIYWSIFSVILGEPLYFIPFPWQSWPLYISSWPASLCWSMKNRFCGASLLPSMKTTAAASPAGCRA